MTTETTTQAAGDNTQAAGGAQTADTTTQSTATQAATTTSETKVDATGETTQAAKTDAPADIVYDFKLPEGVELDTAMADEFKAIAKDLKLPAEAAQKIVDLQVKAQQAAAQAHVDTVKGWRESVVNDKDIGGDKLPENIAIAKKAVSLGPPELNELLKSTGMDNHPVVFRWCLAVGKALSEDRMVKGGTATADASKPAASVLYPQQA